MTDTQTISDALGYLSPDMAREDWAKIAMAIKSEFGDAGMTLFDGWSQGGEKYNERDTRDTWRSVSADGGVGIGTLIYQAKQAGYRPNGAAPADDGRAKLAAMAVKIASAAWIEAQAAPDSHPYLKAKRVRAHGLRAGTWPTMDDAGDVTRWTSGALLVPILSPATGKIMSLQGIFDATSKRYLRHAKKRGGYYLVGQPPADGETLAITEGYATAATIHEATGWPVAVAFDAGNLPLVAGSMRTAFPRALIIICADNDQWTDGNPGMVAAQRAAGACNGRVISPCFASLEGEPTDFNDLATREGQETVLAQLSAAPPAPPATVAVRELVRFPESVDFQSPLIDINGAGKPLATIENLREICARLGVVIRYNVISKEEEIVIPGEAFSIDNRGNASLAWLESWCARFRFPVGSLISFVTYLADQNLHNPVATWIESSPWDGVERVQALCNSIVPAEDKRLPDNRRLSDVLILRWMMSALAAVLEPDGVSAHGILVLQGDQYLGKTMWFKQLVPSHLGVLQDGMILRPDDRDSVKQVCSFWLVELGELDATFRRSDIAALKSFITRKQDVLRRAYARKESAYARRTVFFGSVNPREYLHDPTGNRRYWTIECAEINHAHGLDMQQVWAEALIYYRRGEGYYLSPDEMAALNDHNEAFQAIDPIEERLQTQLDWDASAAWWEWRTATEILISVGVDRPTVGDACKAGHVLRRLNGRQHRRSAGKNLILCPPKTRGGS